MIVKRKLQSIIQKASLFLALIFVSYSAKADCTLPTGTTPASAFLSTYSSCTGVITIPSGAVLDMDVSLTLPSNITKIIIKDGGHINFTTNGAELRLSSNTVLDIENTTDTNPGGSAAAIIASPCNNTKAIFIGSIKYSACTGGGNVCLIFTPLMAQGGSLSLDPVVTVTGNSSLVGNKLCTSTPSNTNFVLNAKVTNNSSFINKPTFVWSVLSQPSGSSNPTFSSTTDSTPTVTTYAVGTYVFRVTAKQNLSTATCTASATDLQEVTADITIVVTPAPVATVTGGGDMGYNPTGSNSKTVTITGSSGSGPEYMINYDLNNSSNVLMSTSGSVLNFTHYNNEPMGDYKYNIVSIADNVCTTTYSTPLQGVVRIVDPLPVTLSNFTLKSENCKNYLTWKTENEVLFDRFEIEKNDNNKGFVTVGRVKAIGKPNTYFFVDDKLNANAVQYRLKLVDYDGNYEYSNTIKSVNACKTIQVTRNESASIYQISGLNENDKVSVMSIEGKLLLEQTSVSNQFQFDISNQPAGIYILKVASLGRPNFIQKIVKN